LGEEHEANGEFGRSDQLRALAREIRGQAEHIRRESCDCPPPALDEATLLVDPPPPADSANPANPAP
jgi:hypothetical protein